MNTTMDARHLTDAELVRALDGEEPGPDAPDPQDHLETCHRCADALDTLRAESRLVSRFLDRAEFEGTTASGTAARGSGLEARGTEARGSGPEARGTEVRGTEARGSGREGRGTGSGWTPSFSWPWLKAAAVLVLVAGPLAAFPDVRSWLVERVAGPSATEAVGGTGAPTVLRFVPDPGDFRVRFPEAASGTLTLERSDAAEAELRAVGGEPEAVVSASSLEIRNDGEGRYRLRLPAAVTGAWVVVGERAVAVTGRQIDGRVAVDLGSRQLR